MAVIEKRKNKNGETQYRVKIRLKGHPAETATFKRLTDAKVWSQNTESEIRSGRYFKSSESRKRLLREAIDRYVKEVLPRKPKSQRDQAIQLLWWREMIGYLTLADVTPAILGEMRNKLLEEVTTRGKLRTPATVNRYLAVISHLFTIAMQEWGWVESNPLRKVVKPKEPRGRARFLDKPELEKLLSVCKNSESAYLYLIVILALSTGARSEEILSLAWKNVDLVRCVIILHDTKNKDTRVLPLAGRALELMKQHAKVRKLNSDFVFPGKNLLNHVDIRSPWRTAIKRAEIKDFRFHDLRHSAASFLAMNGATPSELAAVLGHKSLAMVKRYAHISQAHTVDVVTRMNEKLFAQGDKDEAELVT